MCPMSLFYNGKAKWSKNQRCAPKILHVVEALWDHSLYEESSLELLETDTTLKDLILVISKSAMSGANGACTTCFQGSIHQLPKHILLNSENSSLFISFVMVAQLPHLL